jgi:hypothetical protein
MEEEVRQPEERHSIFKEMKFKIVKIGDEEIPGENIFEIIPPSRGVPYWIIRHADDLDEKEQITIAASVPVVITAEKLDRNQIEDEEEAVIE